MEATTVDYKTSNKASDHRHIYFDQLKPLMIIEWILARQPYKRNLSGEFEFSYWSWRMAYCVAFYVLLLAGSLVTSHDALIHMQQMGVASGANTPTYDTTLYTALLLVFLIGQLIVPLLNWIILHRFINFLNKWQHFQDMHRQVTGVDVAVRGGWIGVYAAASVVVAIAVDVFESRHLLAHLHWSRVLPFLVITLDILCATASWAASTHFISTAANSIYESFRRRNSSSSRRGRNGISIAEHRMLWQEMGRLYADYCACQEYRMLTLVALVMVCLVISCYGLVSATATATVTSLAAFAVPLLYAIGQLIAICEFAHRATQKIGDNFCRKLDWIETSRFTAQEWHEVIYEIVSYLIILMQFQASERMNARSVDDDTAAANDDTG